MHPQLESQSEIASFRLYAHVRLAVERAEDPHEVVGAFDAADFDLFSLPGT